MIPVGFDALRITSRQNLIKTCNSILAPPPPPEDASKGKEGAEGEMKKAEGEAKKAEKVEKKVEADEKVKPAEEDLALKKDRAAQLLEVLRTPAST